MDDNTTLPVLEDSDALLAQDPEFMTLCDERREAWIEAMEDAHS